MTCAVYDVRVKYQRSEKHRGAGVRIQKGIVSQIIWQNESAQMLEIESRKLPAICYMQLTGDCKPGDEVILNCTATQLGLGTGGVDFVVANLTALKHAERDYECGLTTCIGDRPNNIMKLRYTPLQCDVPCVEDANSPFREQMLGATNIDGMPVVCCGLHSQVPLVAAGIRAKMPDAKIVYCMTDEAALVLQYSNLARQCIQNGLINLVITCGQAIGGNLEAVTLHSGLLAARAALSADIAIVSIGPGIAGTGTPYGHGGVAQAQAINATAAIKGRPVAVPRISFADKRERHTGVSHHFITAMGTLTLTSASICLPGNLSAQQLSIVEEQLREAGVFGKHHVLEIPVNTTTQQIDTRDINVTTMGRSIDDDPAFFWAAYCSGKYAAVMALEPRK